MGILKKVIIGSLVVVSGLTMLASNKRDIMETRNFNHSEKVALQNTKLVITKNTNYIEDVEGVDDAMGLMTKWKDNSGEVFPYRVIVELTNEIDEDQDTYYHELAHVIDDMYHLRENITNDMISELPYLVFDKSDIKYYLEHKGEFFAFLYARTRLNPTKVRDVAPKCYEFMNRYFDVDTYIKYQDYNQLKEFN